MVAVTEGGRDARLLAELAGPLDPAKPPFYVKDAGGAADGWYMIPAGSQRAKWLGRNVIWAQRRLVELCRAHDEAAA